MINLYVDTDAAGGGDGSIGSPWNHLATAITALESSGPAARGDAVTVFCSGVAADTDAGGVLNQFDVATTAAHYLRIQGDNTLYGWNTSAYRIEFSNRNGLYNNVTPHLYVANLQVKMTATSGGPWITLKMANANIGDPTPVADAIQRCFNTIVWGIQAGGTVTCFENRPFGAAASGSSEFWNCLVIGNPTQGYTNDFLSGGNLGTFANCTATGCNFGFVNSNQDNRTLVKNCLATNASGIGFVGAYGGTASDYNACDDGNQAPGAHSNPSATFTFVDAAGGNYCLAPNDTGALGLGVTAPLGAEYDDDLQGVTRPAAWSIGALELQAEPATGGGRRLLLGVG